MSEENDTHSDSSDEDEVDFNKCSKLKLQETIAGLFPSKAGKKRLETLKMLEVLKDKNNRTIKQSALDVLKNFDKNEAVGSGSENTSSDAIQPYTKHCSDNDDAESESIGSDNESCSSVGSGSSDSESPENVKLNIIFNVDKDGKITVNTKEADSDDSEIGSDADSEYKEEDDEEYDEEEEYYEDYEESDEEVMSKKKKKKTSKGKTSKGKTSKDKTSKDKTSKGKTSKGKTTKNDDIIVSKDEQDDSFFKLKDKVKVKVSDWDDEWVGRITEVRTRNRYNIRLDDKELEQRNFKLINEKYIKHYTSEDEEEKNVMSELKTLIDIKGSRGSKEMLQKFKKMTSVLENKNKKKQEKENMALSKKNTKSFKKFINNKGNTDEFKFFKKMDYNEQIKLLEEYEIVNEHMVINKPFRIALLEKNIPPHFKAAAMKKINILSFMDPTCGEYYKVKQWVDAFMKIPFDTNINLPVQINDGQDKCSDFMDNAKKILDDCVYGLEDAKMQMMQFLGQLIVNPDSVGCCLALVGPPGTGKTTLIKNAFSKILNRPFSMCALGGAEDGAHWGWSRLHVC